MTKSDDSQGLDNAFRPLDLPSFACFAVKRLSDPYDNAYEEAEMAVLHPRAVAGRRDAFRLGRASAHSALQALGRDDGPILAGNDRQPLWPAGVTGSISHTETVGVALVAPEDACLGVGIDIEQLRFAPELTDQVPVATERAWLERLDGTERDRQTFALFSAKESIFKAFYPRVGRFFGFEAAALTPTGHGFAARLLEDLDEAFPPERDFTVHVSWTGESVLTWVILGEENPAT